MCVCAWGCSCVHGCVSYLKTQSVIQTWEMRFYCPFVQMHVCVWLVSRLDPNKLVLRRLCTLQGKSRTCITHPWAHDIWYPLAKAVFVSLPLQSGIHPILVWVTFPLWCWSEASLVTNVHFVLDIEWGSRMLLVLWLVISVECTSAGLLSFKCSNSRRLSNIWQEYSFRWWAVFSRCALL